MSPEDRLDSKLEQYLEDAHAMETNVQAMLNSMIASTADDRLRARLEQHLEETERHAGRLADRLAERGHGVSLKKEAGAVFGALPKGILDQFRGDKPVQNARDGFVTENLEIAVYEVLERLADRAGDRRTAAVARENRADEERMREYLARNWDRALELTLAAEGAQA